ncbi:hypothetical protein [Lysobacter gummosus]|uniref:hypothetical protein n=1 Tax=Lysobacter gummosus TaxID=262324 RepID=UPI00362D6B6F
MRPTISIVSSAPASGSTIHKAVWSWRRRGITLGPGFGIRNLGFVTAGRREPGCARAERRVCRGRPLWRATPSSSSRAAAKSKARNLPPRFYQSRIPNSESRLLRTAPEPEPPSRPDRPTAGPCRPSPARSWPGT